MRKNILIISIICLLTITISYTYSAFKNTIKGTITATTNNWKFNVNVPSGIKENDYYKVPISESSGSFYIILDNVGSEYVAFFTVNLEAVDLPSDFVINKDLYQGTLNNESRKIKVTYNSSSAVDGYIKIKAKACVTEYAIMKNGGNVSISSQTEFWGDAYRKYIRTIIFGNDLSNLPSECSEENLCWDISESENQKNKVYGYLTDSGFVDDNSNSLYNLYIVSEVPIFAPSDCSWMFCYFSSLISIDFNSNFNTSNVTNMRHLFNYSSSLEEVDVSGFNTSKVISLEDLFSGCPNLLDVDLTNFDTSNVTNMRGMFYNCASLASLDLSHFNTSKVMNMFDMFGRCSASIIINVMNNSIVDYVLNFTSSTPEITINYVSSAYDLVYKMINESKGNNNISFGNSIKEYNVTISGNDDITYESGSTATGAVVTLTSISGNNYVTSFKMNGMLVDGNEFVMPESNVLVTDIITVACSTFETSHYPYSYGQDNLIIGEKMFDSAKSLTVVLDYGMEYIEYYGNAGENAYGSYFYIYDSSSATDGIINNKKYRAYARTKETITINSNYIKITFTSRGGKSGNNNYGLKAIVIPNY